MRIYIDHEIKASVLCFALSVPCRRCVACAHHVALQQHIPIHEKRQEKTQLRVEANHVMTLPVAAAVRVRPTEELVARREAMLLDIAVVTGRRGGSCDEVAMDETTRVSSSRLYSLQSWQDRRRRKFLSFPCPICFLLYFCCFFPFLLDSCFPF